MTQITVSLNISQDAPIDPHLHTTYSDGTWTPESLLDYLVHENFGLAAITDHDRVDIVVAIHQIALDRHLPVNAGVGET